MLAIARRIGHRRSDPVGYSPIRNGATLRLYWAMLFLIPAIVLYVLRMRRPQCDGTAEHLARLDQRPQ